MEDILLINRKANVKPFPFGAVWKTCLRQVFIGHPEDIDNIQLDPCDQILKNESALQYLIEVLCGLHSPIVGETEVFGQFKNFIEFQRSLHNFNFSVHQKWLQFLFAEVKKIRSLYLIGIGSNSYGSLIRKYAKDQKSLTLLGAGQLATEILPWVAHKNDINVISRSPEKLSSLIQKIPHLQLQTYTSATALGEVLVIAAPVKDQDILELLKNHGEKVKVIYDLRGEINTLKTMILPLNSDLEYISLTEFFAALEENKKELEGRLEKIQKIIQERCLHFIERFELRPNGWDDLCA